MRINLGKCAGCGVCIPYCPVAAIKYTADRKCQIDQDKCVECYVCYRAEICSEKAFEIVPLEWPRIIRHILSSPRKLQKITTVYTGIQGRGTEEMKTNDVTGRYNFGEVGFTVELGRPGLGTTIEEVEKVATSVARLGVEFESLNPVTMLMIDKKTGKFRDDVKKERVLSCIIEFKTKEDKLLLVVDTLRDCAKRINTVFSVGCISRVRPDGVIPVKATLDKGGVFYRPNGKVNIGLGRKR